MTELEQKITELNKLTSSLGDILLESMEKATSDSKELKEQLEEEVKKGEEADRKIIDKLTEDMKEIVDFVDFAKGASADVDAKIQRLKDQMKEKYGE